MKNDLRNSILKAAEIKTIKIIYEGIDIFVKDLTAAEQAKYEAVAYKDGKLREDFYIYYLVLALREENGDRIFSDADIDELKSRKAGVLLGIWRQAINLNLTGDINESDTEKNSEAQQPATTATN